MSDLINDCIDKYGRYRKRFHEEDLGVGACPYYSKYGLFDYGLLAPFDGTTIGEIAIEGVCQTIINPIATCLGNLYIAINALLHMGYSLYLGAINLFNETEENYFYSALDASFAVGYFFAHAIIDPLWETLAAITRTLTTIGFGVVAGAGYAAGTIANWSNTQESSGSEIKAYPRNGVTML